MASTQLFGVRQRRLEFSAALLIIVANAFVAASADAQPWASMALLLAMDAGIMTALANAGRLQQPNWKDFMRAHVVRMVMLNMLHLSQVQRHHISMQIHSS